MGRTYRSTTLKPTTAADFSNYEALYGGRQAMPLTMRCTKSIKAQLFLAANAAGVSESTFLRWVLWRHFRETEGLDVVTCTAEPTHV